MDKRLMLYDIYNLLLKKEEHTITMDDMSKQLKCSKKSLYKLFPSKTAMLFEVFSLYEKHFMGLLNDIALLDCSETQKLVFQIKALNRNATIFFNSHLYNQLKNKSEFDPLLTKSEQGLYSVSFRRIVDNIEASKSQKENLINILIFISISIKRRFTLPNAQKNIDDDQFLDMMLTLILSYIKQENIKGNHRIEISTFGTNTRHQKSSTKVTAL